MPSAIHTPLILNPAIRDSANHSRLVCIKTATNLLLASLHRKAPKMQSAIRTKPVKAPTRLNPQSTMRKLKTASPVRTWNCAGPGAASKPEAPEGCGLRRFPRRFRS
eukprot:6876229-Alexandrium_andersonii.AAC.1